MPVKGDMVAESIAELKKAVKLMGDGKFEPIHWAGDPVISAVLTELAKVKEIEGEGMMIGMTTMAKMVFAKKNESEAEAAEQLRNVSNEAAGQAALLFLAGYRLGRKDAEVDTLERML